MKKTIIIAILALTTIFVGCYESTGQDTYTVLKYSFGGFVDGRVEYCFKDEKYENYQPPQEVTCTFMDKTLTGVYEGERRGLDVSHSKLYRYNVGENIELSIDAEGRLVSYYDVSKDATQADEPLYDKDVFIQAAEDCITEQGLNASDYTISASQNTYQGYNVKLAKYLQGVPTVEEININFNYDCTVRWYYAVMPGSITKEDKLEIDIGKAENAVLAKVEQEYDVNDSVLQIKKANGYYKQNVEIKNWRAAKLKDGKIALICDVEISLVTDKTDIPPNLNGLLSFAVMN
ncbi:MAG: hypothetical protein IKK58_00815 [Clostridia bacterium]|nr:hypothetical protein [Clostridia bacterium]